VIELFLAGIRILPHDRSNTEAMLLRARPAFTDLRKRSQTSAATHLIARKANAGAATEEQRGEREHDGKRKVVSRFSDM
jgi:hypothetical protein